MEDKEQPVLQDNTMDSDDLTMQGARASAAMV